MWDNSITLTTAANTANVAFEGRGSLMFSGTFGSGTIEIRPITESGVIAADAIITDNVIDGSAANSADVPSGHYQLTLDGSTGATVSVFKNDQSDKAITR